MLFNSYVFIFLFLPITLLIYFGLNKRKLVFISLIWLVFTSLAYYGWQNPKYVLLITGSIVFNYTIGTWLRTRGITGSIFKRKFGLIAGISGNLLLLGVFKYADFFISNVNYLAGLQTPLPHITLPVGISFFTFTQIAYLVDAGRGDAKRHTISVYALFVSFFPYLLAGPIIHHKELIPQFCRLREKLLNTRNLNLGIYLFFMGLFKKLVIADAFAGWVSNGFDHAVTLTFIEAWATSLSYTLQLYFDFSGYTDMALGTAMMFNIKLPINFDSPYQSSDIQEFWRRWHITLGRFVRDYIYIPLGGSRISEARTLLNLMVTFLLVGLWHGAGWTFVLWGGLHGAALAAHRLWKRCPVRMPKMLGWFLTFNFVNAAWVFFRARTLKDAVRVLGGMAGMNGLVLPEALRGGLKSLQSGGVRFGECLVHLGGGERTMGIILAGLLLCLLFRNSNEMVSRFKPDLIHLVFASVVALISILHLGSHSEFLYFRF